MATPMIPRSVSEGEALSRPDRHTPIHSAPKQSGPIQPIPSFQPPRRPYREVVRRLSSASETKWVLPNPVRPKPFRAPSNLHLPGHSKPFPRNSPCLVVARGPSTQGSQNGRRPGQHSPSHNSPVHTTIGPDQTIPFLAFPLFAFPHRFAHTLPSWWGQVSHEKPRRATVRCTEPLPKPTEPTMIQREIDLHLTDIYGGDGFERPETVKEVTLEESKTTITVRKDVGVPVEKERERKQVKEKEISVFTFKRDDDGTPLYRLGGTHGKLWGCMKEAGVLLYQMGEQQNKVTTERIMKAVQIQPQWVRLEMPDGVEMTQDTLPQELQGRNSAMVEHHYDVVPEANATVTITHPEAFGDKVDEYLEHAQTINFGNKRRGTLEIVNQEVTEV